MPSWYSYNGDTCQVFHTLIACKKNLFCVLKINFTILVTHFNTLINHGLLSQDLHELQHLVVAGNQISYVERHSVPRTLRHLHLGRNQIQNLNDSLR